MKLNVYRKSYDFQPHECPADADFCELIKSNEYFRLKKIFHFGTGNHHVIGKINHDKDFKNSIIGVTLQDEEHFAYIQMLKRNPMYAKYYKVIYADIFTLNNNFLPVFDIVNLFHLGEYFHKGTPYYQFDTEINFLKNMIDHSSRDAKFIFYKRSRPGPGFEMHKKQIESETNLKLEYSYKSLLIYKKEKIEHDDKTQRSTGKN